MAKWTKIEDSKIQHVWKCPECGVKAIIPPTFYNDNGTPMCIADRDCEGTDMEYSHTEILK